MRFRAKKGFTIAEVLVAGGILLLFFGLLTKVLVPAMRYSAYGSVKVELQQQGILALNRIVNDLQLSVAQGLSVTATPPNILGINQFANLDSEGRPSWSDAIKVYHLNATQKQLVSESNDISPFTSTAPNRVTDAQLLTFATTPGGDDERILAHNVEDFVVEPPVAATGTTPPQPLVIRLTLEKEVPHDPRDASVELVRSVYLRNSL